LCVLSDHEWRVADRRQDEQSPEKVLGYINQSGSIFEVLNIVNIRSPGGRCY
jgi:hypothetical protein